MNISIKKIASFFANSKDVHPRISRIVTNLVLWVTVGELFTIAKMFSLPLALEVDWKAPLLLLGGAMVVVFAITCVKRKTLDTKSIKSCDETIDFVMDEVSSSILNVGGICAALAASAQIEGFTDIELIFFGFGCYGLFLLLEKKSKNMLSDPRQTSPDDQDGIYDEPFATEINPQGQANYNCSQR